LHRERRPKFQSARPLEDLGTGKSCAPAKGQAASSLPSSHSGTVSGPRGLRTGDDVRDATAITTASFVQCAPIFLPNWRNPRPDDPRCSEAPRPPVPNDGRVGSSRRPIHPQLPLAEVRDRVSLRPNCDSGPALKLPDGEEKNGEKPISRRMASGAVAHVHAAPKDERRFPRSRPMNHHFACAIAALTLLASTVAACAEGDVEIGTAAGEVRRASKSCEETVCPRGETCDDSSGSAQCKAGRVGKPVCPELISKPSLDLCATSEVLVLVTNPDGCGDWQCKPKPPCPVPAAPQPGFCGDAGIPTLVSKPDGCQDWQCNPRLCPPIASPPANWCDAGRPTLVTKPDGCQDWQCK
jgi:hypothetical protein